MNKKFITKHWYANAYEQFENQTNDVEFFIDLLREQTDGIPQNILEVACGGGRISVPLAKAGHNVTGFDADEFMLLRCYNKMKGIPNITCYQADAILDDWGTGFDVVIMAGNILINIELEVKGSSVNTHSCSPVHATSQVQCGRTSSTFMSSKGVSMKNCLNYAEAQQLFIHKAAAALRMGGYLLLDYDQHSEASADRFFNYVVDSERLDVATEYGDDLGTVGKFQNYGGVYDPVTRICTWASHTDLTTNNGEQIIESTTGYKHIPSLAQVYGWLVDAGFVIEKTYRNYKDEPLSENEPDYVKATIWARYEG